MWVRPFSNNMCLENGSDQLFVYRGIDRYCKVSHSLIQTIFEGRPVSEHTGDFMKKVLLATVCFIKPYRNQVY